jgi:hypothetical protein
MEQITKIDQKFQISKHFNDKFSEVAKDIDGSFLKINPFISGVWQNLDRSSSACLSLWLHL